MSEFNTPATYASNYDFDTITSVPTEDIARWAARINLINYALEENRAFDNGDTVGYMYQNLNQFAREGGDWQCDPAMEDIVTYELMPAVTYDKVINAPNRSTANPHNSEDAISGEISRTALRRALGRIGLYRDAEPHTPLEAAAALHYLRRNIKDPVDRKLYERADEIDEAAAAISGAVLARMTERAVLKPISPDGPCGPIQTLETTCGDPLTEQEEEVLREIGLLRANEDAQGNPILFEEVSLPMSVYQKAEVLTEAEARNLGLDPESVMNLWWQELQRDLTRIDQASTQQQ